MIIHKIGYIPFLEPTKASMSLTIGNETNAKYFIYKRFYNIINKKYIIQ